MTDAAACLDASTLLRIRRDLRAAGYSDKQIDAGLDYAAAQLADDEQGAFRIAVGRILYSDEQLADGAMFVVE